MSEIGIGITFCDLLMYLLEPRGYAGFLPLAWREIRHHAVSLATRRISILLLHRLFGGLNLRLHVVVLEGRMTAWCLQIGEGDFA